jgi:hypothetical protein
MVSSDEEILIKMRTKFVGWHIDAIEGTDIGLKFTVSLLGEKQTFGIQPSMAEVNWTGNTLNAKFALTIGVEE